MNSIKCYRCKNDFYVAFPVPQVTCPFCGYSLSNSNSVRRKDVREKVEKGCKISNGFGQISARVIDTSTSGVGIKIFLGKLPFKTSDIIKISFFDMDSDVSAKVVWISKSREAISKVGLKLCQEEPPGNILR